MEIYGLLPKHEIKIHGLLTSHEVKTYGLSTKHDHAGLKARTRFHPTLTLARSHEADISSCNI